MHCTKCGAENRAGARFCDACGAALAETSSKSAAPNVTGAVDVRVNLQDVGPELPEGERKTVTALFADIKGSTELMEQLDPEQARAIIDPALKIMVDAVRSYEGYVVQSTGDGIFALFGAPAAYEDHPQRALYAALQMQQNLREYSERLVNQGRSSLEARFGVNTGEVVVRTVETGGKVEYTPIGHTANLAARLQTLAPAGSIAISDGTRKLVEGYFELRTLGPRSVRGISAPIDVYEVINLGPLRSHFEVSARRGLTRFVGREPELQQINRALERVISGHGELVAVVAEAGTGKSRLFHEFKATLPPVWKVLEAYSASYGRASAWLPILELLRIYFGLQDEDDPANRRQKVSSTLEKLDPGLSTALPYLAGLLGIQENPDPFAQMDPQIRRQRTRDAIKRIVLRESRAQPTIIIFEDLHWIDSETQALLDLLVDAITGARVLLLVNYRPEYRHEWSSRSHYLQLRLDPLSEQNASAILTELLGQGTELGELRRLIAERTGGNPFFIEEMVQALLQQGILARNGAVKLVRPMAEAHLPITVQGVLAARIDRLPSAEKELLQTLAVIGNDFSPVMARSVTQLPEEVLERRLVNLRVGEFIYERPMSAEAEYSFKHALTHEVAYNSLLIERRKILHERTGQALESMFAKNLDDHLSELARHYGHGDNIDKAVEYLGRFGEQTMQRSAFSEAITSLNSAIDLLQKLPETPDRARRELRITMALGAALTPLKGYTAPEVERAYTRAREICEQLGDPLQLFHALNGLRSVYMLRAEQRTAYELSKQMLQTAQGVQDPALLVLAHGGLGLTLLEMGIFPAAREHLETALSLYGELPRSVGSTNWAHASSSLDDAVIFYLSYLAISLLILGYPEQAVKRSNEAVASAQALSHPHILAAAHFFAARLRQNRREARITQEMAERLAAVSAEHGLSFWFCQSKIIRGGALAQQGRYQEGIGEMNEGLAALTAKGPRLSYLWLLVQARIDAGQLEEALTVLRELLAAADQHRYPTSEPEAYRLKGELLLRQNDFNATEAESCFKRAIEIARNQSARFSELRATMSLARLLARENRRDEARTMLAEIYNWFTEGFDTADLKDAKALLDELAG